MRLQFLPELGQLIAGGVALDQRAAKPLFEHRKTALYGGLVDAQCLCCSYRAAFACEREKVFQIVPIKHGLSMQVCGVTWQPCGSPQLPRPCSIEIANVGTGRRSSEHRMIAC